MGVVLRDNTKLNIPVAASKPSKTMKQRYDETLAQKINELKEAGRE
jgi:hypothetical protein